MNQGSKDIQKKIASKRIQSIAERTDISGRLTRNSQRVGSVDPSDYSALTTSKKKVSKPRVSSVPVTRSEINSEQEDLDEEQEIENSLGVILERQTPHIVTLESTMSGENAFASGSGLPGSSEPVGSQTTGNQNNNHGNGNGNGSSGTRRRLIKPRAREAPRFDPESPADLLRFLSEIDDAFSDAGITDDTTRKDNVGRYTDTNTQDKWEALDDFDTMSWAEFKLKLISMYPAVKNKKAGSLKALSKICKQYKNLDEDESEDLANLQMEFMAEAKKLLARGMTSHRELIDMVRKCLDPSFSRMIWQEVRTKLVQDDEEELENVRIEQFFKIATKLSRGSTNFEYLRDENVQRNTTVSSSTGNREKTTIVKTEDTTKYSEMTHLILGQADKMKALENSVVTLHGQTSQRIDDMIKELQQINRTAQRPYVASSQEQTNYRGNNNNQTSSGYRGPGPCYFCGENGHIISSCTVKQAYATKGYIKETDTGVRMPNGSFVPAIPGTQPNERTMKDRVDAAMAKTQNFLEQPTAGPGGYYNVSQEDLDNYAQGTFHQSSNNNPDVQLQMINALNENSRYMRVLQETLPQRQVVNSAPGTYQQFLGATYAPGTDMRNTTQPAANIQFTQQPNVASMSQPPQQQQPVGPSADGEWKERMSKVEDSIGQLVTILKNGVQSGF